MSIFFTIRNTAYTSQILSADQPYIMKKQLTASYRRKNRRTKSVSFVRNNNQKISYLENQCVKDHPADHRVHNGPSHHALTCPFVETSNAYPTYTDFVERDGVSSIKDCQKYCSESKHFICRSFGYYGSNNQCFISGDDRASAGSTAIQSRSGMTYFERKCDAVSLLNGSSSSSQRPSSSSTTDSSEDHHLNEMEEERSGHRTESPTVVTSGRPHRPTQSSLYNMPSDHRSTSGLFQNPSSRLFSPSSPSTSPSSVNTPSGNPVHRSQITSSGVQRTGPSGNLLVIPASSVGHDDPTDSTTIRSSATPSSHGSTNPDRSTTTSSTPSTSRE